MLGRVVTAVVTPVVIVWGLSACGPSSGSATDTLPPIRTTTSTTSTTTTPYSGRIYYEVARDDNLNAIANAYDVPIQAIKDLNGLTSDVLQVGQILEIPNDVRLDTELPTTTDSTPESTEA